MPLATLAQLKLHLDITDTTQDALLQQLLDIATSAVCNYIPSYGEEQTLTQYYDGNGQIDLPLKRRPVNLNVTPQVWIDTGGYYGQGDGAFPDSSSQTYGSDFIVIPDDTGSQVQSNSAILRRLGLGFRFDVIGRPYNSLATRYRQSVWPAGQGNIKVTYKAGWSAVPMDVTGAVLDMAALCYRTRLYGGTYIANSERLGEYSYTLAMALNGQGPLSNNLATVQGKLAPYREFTI